MEDELSAALVTGPFSLALRLAIRDRGLSLDRLADRLAKAGTPVSRTALSYWQHGRSRPEREDSLLALTQAERILGVPPQSLHLLLGPARPRRRLQRGGEDILTTDRVWERPDGVHRALQQVGCGPEEVHQFRMLAFHGVTTIDAERRMTTVEMSFLLEAWRAGADRYFHLYCMPGGDPADVRITNLAGCRLGRVYADQPTGCTAFELLLDAPRNPGDLVPIRCTVEPSTRHVDDSRSIRVQPGLRTLTEQVRFAPQSLPVRVLRQYATSVDAQPLTEEVRVGAGWTVELSAVDPSPGLHTLKWDWT